MKVFPVFLIGLTFIVSGYYSGWKMHNSEGRYHQMTGLDDEEKTYVRKTSAKGSILCGIGWIIHGCISILFPNPLIILCGKILMIVGIAYIVIPYIKLDRWL